MGNKIQLKRTQDTAIPTLDTGELVWSDRHATGGGPNGTLYIGDAKDGTARIIGGIGTGFTPAQATKLATSRTIGGTAFDGTADITPGNATLAASATVLATSRTIGGTAFNGSANITPANATLAATATALDNARTIGGVSFDGTANINLPGVNATGSQDTSGTAADATVLETARTIGGVSFNGSANIDLPGVNTAGSQATSGNAGTATALANARTIGGTAFDGTANIAVGTAGTATALANARTIGGVSFDGTANINLPGVNAAGSQDTSGTAAGLTGSPNITTGTINCSDITTTGDMIIGGDTTTVESTIVAISDSMFELAKDQDDSYDVLDFGFYGVYGVSNTAKYAGFFRDCSEAGDPWVLYDGLEVKPTTTVNTGGAGYSIADVKAAKITATNDFSGSGASLTNIPAGQLTGDVADARIPALTSSKLTGALPAISGGSLTGLNGTQITSGTVPTARTAAKCVDANADQTSANTCSEPHVGTNISWTAGTTAGPRCDSSTGNNAVIPSAAAGASGIVTTGAQSFAGAKTFGTTIVGSVSGSSATCSGNSATATTLVNARTIGGTAFDGSANITPANATLAATATALATARTIAGVSFDGTANIALNNNNITNGAGYGTGTLGVNSPINGGTF